jgi:hypothetical protein
MGPKDPRSTVLKPEERRWPWLSVGTRCCRSTTGLYALQATIPHLTRSSLHRMFQRHKISRLPEIEGERATKKTFKANPIGFFHLDPRLRGDKHCRGPHRARQALAVCCYRPHIEGSLRQALHGSQPQGGFGFPGSPDRARSLQNPHRLDR